MVIRFFDFKENKAVCVFKLRLVPTTSEPVIFFFLIQLNRFLCCHDEKMAVADKVADKVT